MDALIAARRRLKTELFTYLYDGDPWMTPGKLKQIEVELRGIQLATSPKVVRVAALQDKVDTEAIDRIQRRYEKGMSL